MFDSSKLVITVMRFERIDHDQFQPLVEKFESSPTKMDDDAYYVLYKGKWELMRNDDWSDAVILPKRALHTNGGSKYPTAAPKKWYLGPGSRRWGTPPVNKRKQM